MPAKTLTALVLLVILGPLVGCGGGGASSGDAGQVRAAMRILGAQYGQYMVSHGQAAPKDEAAMREYVQSRMSELSANGVKSLDDLFRAGRDGQPLKLVVGARIVAPELRGGSWAVYEQTGVDGKRLAADSNGGVQELSGEDFAKKIPVK